MEVAKAKTRRSDVIGVEMLITNDTGMRLNIDQTTFLSRTALRG